MTRAWVLLSLVFVAACSSTPPKEQPPAMMSASSAMTTAHAGEASSPVGVGATTSSTAASASNASAGTETNLLHESAPAYPGAIPPKTEDEKESEKYPDRFMARFAGFALSNVETRASVGPANSGASGTIDFNNTLGLSNNDFSGRVDSWYRFSEHSGIGFSWYTFRLSGSRAIDRSIDWNGQTYAINTQIDSFLDQDIYKLNYRYSFYHNNDIEFGASAGFNIQHYRIGLSVPNQGASNSEAVTAPLPVFGAFVNYNFTERFSLNLEYEFFFLDIDNASGSLQDFLLGLEYRVFRNVALGAAFDFYGLDADYSSNSKNITLSQSWQGFMLYVSVYL